MNWGRDLNLEIANLNHNINCVYYIMDVLINYVPGSYECLYMQDFIGIFIAIGRLTLSKLTI